MMISKVPVDTEPIVAILMKEVSVSELRARP